MAADLESLVGTALGDYTLTSVIGRGPGGVVFAAKHQKLHGLRACKVLSATTDDAPDQVARALRAAALISRIRHPNLIKIYDSDETAGRRPYLIMELLSGQRLDERMQKERLSAELIATLADQMCAGLAAAHAAALPHLFLKPANVFLLASAPGELTVKLTDFGDWGTVEGPDAVYQAPEQLAGQAGDQRSDIYALGCILYALCCGAPPFAASTAAGVRAARPAQPLPITALPPGVRPEIGAVLQRALAKNPQERQPTAEALWSELRPCLPEPLPQSVTGASPRASQSLVAPANRFTRRRRLGLLAAVGLLAGAGGLLLWFIRTPPPAAPLKTDPQSLRALAEQVLLAGLRQREPALRQRAAEALSHSRDSRYDSWLEPLLGDPEPAVQAAAARALGAIGAPAAIAALRTCVSDQSNEPRLACAESLQLLGDPSSDTEPLIEQSLRRAAPGSPQAVEILSHRALRGRADARLQLEQLLPASEALTESRLPAVATLLRLGSQRAQELVSAAVRVPGPLQVAAAQLLCAADDPTGQPLLREVVAEQKSPERERAIAASGLGSCGDKTDAVILANLLHKPRQPELLRLALAEALLSLSSSDPAVLSHSGLAWAEQALSDERWSVRESAALLLGDVDLGLVGRLARRGRSTALLLGAAADRDVHVRLAALQSLGKQGARQLAKPQPSAEEHPDVEQLRAAVRARATAAGKDEREQLRAAVVLEQLGSGSQLPILQAALRSRDPAVRRFALKEATGHAKLSSQDVAPLLKDDDVQVRFLAASLLAERNDDRGRSILRLVVTQGGADAVRARLLLTTLADEQEPLDAEQLSAYAKSPDPLVRLSAVEAGLRLLPKPAALALLERLVRDADSVVRFRVAEAVSGFLAGGQRSASRKILRRMLRDTDAAVRARAGLFLASDEALHGRPDTSDEGKDKPHPAPPSEPAQQEAAIAEAAGPRGKGSPEESLTTLQIKNLLGQISGALARRDYQKAELALQRASALCRQQTSKNAACARTMPTLSFQLAAIYEKQQKWSLALSEYERTKQLASAARELRAESDKAIARLSKQLGHLLIYKPVGGKCKRVEMWMQPGNQRFAVNGQTRTVLLSAGETAEVRTCK